jgi:ABC-type multidrug transport system fused ATPase/permease subunit
VSLSYHEDEILGAAYDARLTRRLLTYVRPYRGMVVLSIILLLLTSAASLVGPYIVRVASGRPRLPRVA